MTGELFQYIVKIESYLLLLVLLLINLAEEAKSSARLYAE